MVYTQVKTENQGTGQGTRHEQERATSPSERVGHRAKVSPRAAVKLNHEVRPGAVSFAANELAWLGWSLRSSPHGWWLEVGLSLPPAIEHVAPDAVVEGGHVPDFRQAVHKRAQKALVD